jgi:phosphatidylserine decarboxylase
MRSPIHPEGLFLVSILTFLGLVASRISRGFGRLFYLAAGFTAFFFRDPERRIPEGEGLIVSPADGKVVGIERIDQTPTYGAPCNRVSIFLSVFNVHINRSPIAGKVVFRHFQPGKFFPANADKASTENEQNVLIIDDNGFRVMVKQIAGIIARRIVCWVDPGAGVTRGERFGLIRFGSRTELYLPVSAQIKVKVGDHVQGGSTVIATRS